MNDHGPGAAEGQTGLAALAVRNQRATIMVMVSIVILGLVAYRTTPRMEDPQVIAPGYTVTVIVPGATPEKVEELATKHVEKALLELDEVEFVEGFSGGSVCYLAGKVYDDADMPTALQNARKKLSEVRGKLPPEALEPVLVEFNTFDIPILIYALSGQYGTKELRDFTDLMKERIELVPGVAEVIVEGVEPDEVDVQIDPARLKNYGLGVLSVASALGMGNLAIPGAAFNLGTGRFMAQGRNRYETLEEIESAIVGFSGAAPVRIRDLGTVRKQPADLGYFARFNGQRAAAVSVRQKRNADIFAVTAGVEEQVAALRATKFPAGLAVEAVSVQREGVARVLEAFEGNLLQGFLFIGGLTLFHMGLRSTFVILGGLPLGMLLSLVLMSLAGILYHKMSIFSLVFVMGMMIENNIIMGENIFRCLEEDQSGDTQATIATAAQAMVPAVLGSTLTTMAAFAPLFLVDGITGAYIRSLPQTVCIALISSAVTTIVFTPLLAHWAFLASPPERKRAAGHEPLEGFAAFEHRANLAYRAFMAWAFDHKVLMIGSSVACFALCLRLIPLLGIEYFPVSDRGQFVIDMLCPARYGLEATDGATRRLEEVLANTSGVKNFLVYVGKGVPRFHYNIYRRDQTTYSNFLVTVDRARGFKVPAVIEQVRRASRDIPGCNVTFQEVKEGPRGGTPIALRVLGDDYEGPIVVADRLVEQLKKVAGTVDVERDDFEHVPSLKVRVDELKARMLGLDPDTVAKVVRAAVEGLSVTRYLAGEGKELDVVVRLGPRGAASPDSLRGLEFPTTSGAFVPLSQFAELGVEGSLSIRYRREARPTVRVRSGVRGTTPARVLQDLQALPKDFIPENVTLQYGGENEQRDRSFRRLGWAMVVAITVSFLILTAEFNSFAQPLVIIFCLPLAIIGAVIGLFVTGWPFGFMAFLGFVALTGVVTDDAIVLFEYANELRAKGWSIRDAVVESGIVRHRPIYLTTADTIVGMLPLAWAGDPLWAPLACVIIAGSAVCTVLTLVVIPVCYVVGERG